MSKRIPNHRYWGTTVSVGVLAAAALLPPRPAHGAFVFIEATTKLASGQGDDLHDVFIRNVGTDEAAAEDEHGSNVVASIGRANSPASWSAEAGLSLRGTTQNPGAVATADATVTITDEVIIDTPDAKSGEMVSWAQPLYISGSTTGFATAPGYFQVDGSYVVTFNDEVIDQDVQSLSSDLGFTNRLPATALIVFDAPANTAIDLRFLFRTSALGYTGDVGGEALGSADYSNTFILGEATSVLNVTTGQAIPTANFHLLGDGGFDWAHPPAVPEPATGLLVLPAMMAALSARHRRAHAIGA